MTTRPDFSARPYRQAHPVHVPDGNDDIGHRLDGVLFLIGVAVFLLAVAVTVFVL